MALIEDYKREEYEFRKTLKTAVGYSLLSNICMLGMPVFMFQVYDRVLHSRSMETLAALALFAFVILLVYGFYDYVKNMLLIKAATKFESNLSGLILAGELSRQSDANAQSVRDLATLKQVASSPAFSSIFDLPMMPLYFALLFFIDSLLGLAVVFGGLVILGFGIWGARSTTQVNKLHLDAVTNANRSLDMHLSSQELIRAQGLYKEAVMDWGSKYGEQLHRHMESSTKMTAFAATSKALRQIIQVMLIATGAILVLTNEASGGVIFAAAMIGSRALSPIESIVGSWRTLVQAKDIRARLMQRLEDISLPENRTQLPMPKGALAFDRLAYLPRPGAKPIIKGITGKIDAGTSVAIIGPSGAGKSTLAKLMVGYYLPTAGSISLDGQDIHTWDPTARGQHIGYMPQQITFFTMSIRENIARMRMDDPEELAIDAAKLAGVHDLIMSLPDGYDTMIDRNTFQPSGGQAQLIALARAFYGRPKVLVLDEPNAALDQDGEATLHRALKTANSLGMTVVLITQRPSVLKFVDKVMLLKDGLVQDYGDKDKVMNSGSVTTDRKLYKQKVASAKKAAEQQAAEKSQSKEAQTVSLNEALEKAVSQKKTEAAKKAASKKAPSQKAQEKVGD